MKESKILLLDLLSINRPVSVKTIADISIEQWRVLLAMADMHRLQPLLYWRLIKERQLVLPKEVTERLTISLRKSAMHMLQIQAELVCLSRILDLEQVDYMVLKGAYLAFDIYPNSALRPMRDIDILVPEEQIERAYQALLAAGYCTPSYYRKVNLESVSEFNKHYPGLQSATGNVLIELHLRVLTPEVCRPEDPSEDPGLWQRREKLIIAGQTIQVMSTMDLLLHLIVHGCHDHRFNNGPLLISDVQFLLKKGTVDWSWFWTQAKRFNVIKGCILTLRMVEFYLGKQKIEYLQDVNNEEEHLEQLLSELSLLMLQNFDLRAENINLSRVKVDIKLRHKVSYVLKKFFPSPEGLGLLYPVKKNSPAIVYFYALNFFRVIKKIPMYCRIKSAGEGDTLRQLVLLKDWLRDETG